MTSSGKNGLNIRPKCKSQMGQDQVSGGVSVLCWLAAPVEYTAIRPLGYQNHENPPQALGFTLHDFYTPRLK